ncbi:tryptophan--tRNA ligase [Candidatus Berkelbacteria bacterium]|nr:tryptophan--tRNA ligase [Candidatus Berkelbacteria bacterium]
MAKVFSAIRPSGELHLGNYLGAIRQWVELQEKYTCFFAVADYHAITTPFDPKKLPGLTEDVVAWFLAAGLDPNKVTLFRQSDVSEHTELSWLITTITPLGELERMTQFKEKTAEQKGGVTAGLLSYPTLMAADILLYGAQLVPVGEDQVQHIEFTRDVVRRFSHRFGKVFTEPKPLLTTFPRIMSLSNPSEKMSKTGNSGIALSDSPEAIERKIMTAVTDTKPTPGTVSAGVANLFGMLELFDKPLATKLRGEYDQDNFKYVTLKQALANAVIKELTPLQKKHNTIINEQGMVKTVLAEGALKARPVAQKTLDQTKKLMGLA